jgi:hypothetical protein
MFIAVGETQPLAPAPASLEKCFRLQRALSHQVTGANGRTIGHRHGLFQFALAPFSTSLMAGGRLLEVVRKTDDTDRDQIDGDHVVEKAGHQQDKNSGDQSDQWADHHGINGHGSSPTDGLERPIRLLSEIEHKPSLNQCRAWKNLAKT